MRSVCARFFLVVLFGAMPFSIYADTASQRAQLQAQLDELNREIQQNQSQLEEQQRQRSSLERDVAILDSKIQQAQLEIKRRNLTITQLKNDIADKQAGIESLDSQVAAGQQSLARILRRTREIDDLSFAQVLLQGSFSDLFREISDFELIQEALGKSFTVMATQRSDLSARKIALQDKQQEEQDLLQIQVLQQNSLKAIERQKQDLIAAAKGQESIYQQIIANKQQSAAQIKAALFGLRDTSAIPFGTAYQYAKEAEAVTGVRAALTLAIMTQETNLGENVGQCLLTNQPNKGNGKGKNTGTPFSRVMKPDRDVDPFMQITAELGLDPYMEVVSCPQSIGYGGAMGPAQFIPSTWVLYKDRIARATGEAPPNPWNARTAIFATALFMADLGADTGTYASERKAALRYFAGSNWNKPAFAFYGNAVMDFAEKYQRDIGVLGG